MKHTQLANGVKRRDKNGGKNERISINQMREMIQYK
jgi:hypothetical protein